MRAALAAQELLTVQCRDGVPILFRRPARTRGAAVLRGPRWYRVRAVVASWSEVTPWWRMRSGALRSAGAGSSGADTSGDRSSGDRTVWRVEARPAREPLTVKGARRGQGIDVFDLIEHPDGRWLLLRAHD
jgi:Family of unknown function (DUF6504)